MIFKLCQLGESKRTPEEVLMQTRKSIQKRSELCLLLPSDPCFWPLVWGLVIYQLCNFITLDSYILAVNYESLLLGFQAFACNESHVISVVVMSCYFAGYLWHFMIVYVIQCLLLAAYGCQSG
jgi:hypothetical protein